VSDGGWSERSLHLLESGEDVKCCAWCENPAPFVAWTHLVVENGEEFDFCHAGCLVHWLFTKVPDYFDEIARSVAGEFFHVVEEPS
jgi:hypothetical protein